MTRDLEQAHEMIQKGQSGLYQVSYGMQCKKQLPGFAKSEMSL